MVVEELQGHSGGAGDGPEGDLLPGGEHVVQALFGAGNGVVVAAGRRGFQVADVAGPGFGHGVCVRRVTASLRAGVPAPRTRRAAPAGAGFSSISVMMASRAFCSVRRPASHTLSSPIGAPVRAANAACRVSMSAPV